MAGNAPDDLIPLREAVATIAAIYESTMRCPIAEANDLALKAIVRRLSNGLATAYAAQWYLSVEWNSEDKSYSDSGGKELPMEFWLCFEQATDFAIHDWVAGEFAFWRDASEEWHGFEGFAHLLQVSRKGLPLIDDSRPLGAGDRAGLLFRSANQRPPVDHAIEVQAAMMAEVRRGRRPAKWWPDFAEELAVFCLEEGLPAGTGTEGQSDVLSAVFARMTAAGKPEPSRTTVQNVVNQVLLRWRAGN